MSQFGKCFRKPYLRNRIVRHTQSQKSQYLKPEQKTFRNHLNTVYLNQKPRRYDRAEPPKAMLNLRSKRVLVVDDFVTNGRSLDTARAYIEAAKGTATLFRGSRRSTRAFTICNPILSSTRIRRTQSPRNQLRRRSGTELISSIRQRRRNCRPSSKLTTVGHGHKFFPRYAHSVQHLA
jgi:hypothetical protein